MKFVDKVICAIFLFISICAYSQNIIHNLPPTVILTEREVSLDEDETIGLDSLMNLSSQGMIDPTMVPAARLYNFVWDNLTVNPYGQRVVDMPDTLVIDFSQYNHANRLYEIHLVQNLTMSIY